MRVIDVAVPYRNHRVNGVVLMRLQMMIERVDVKAISPSVAARKLAYAHLIPSRRRLIKFAGEDRHIAAAIDESIGQQE